jgi:hypothetical protein
VHVDDDHGDIVLESKSPAALGNIQVTTHHGDVQLKLPPKANFQYQLRTSHGEISSNFESVRGSGGEGSNSASGVVGSGGVKVAVTSDTGDIALDRSDTSSAAPAAPSAPPATPEKPRKPKKPGDEDIL